MSNETPEVMAARQLAAEAGPLLERSPSFQCLEPTTQAAILLDLGKIRYALSTEPAAPRRNDPYALTLDTPEDFRRRLGQRHPTNGQSASGDAANPGGAASASGTGSPGPRVAATESLARRAGALSDEINFPAFVAGLVHGTFDAIVDATIRQMEAFADLVSTVAKDVDSFTRDNVTLNQAFDWLAHQYPNDLALEVPSGADAGQPRLHPRPRANADAEPAAPDWLADYDLAGQPLTDELISEELVPAARRKIGEDRLQMLATMVLLGMSRVNVKDGSISAKVRFRAAASDKAAVNYAVNSDPGGQSWGERGSATYDQHSVMISTVGVNVQADTDLKAELFGEVKINFVSETLPLDRFADSARVTLLQRNARWSPAQPATGNGNAAPTLAPTPAAAAPPASAPGSSPALPPTAVPTVQGGGK